MGVGGADGNYFTFYDWFEVYKNYVGGYPIIGFENYSPIRDENPNLLFVIPKKITKKNQKLDNRINVNKIRDKSVIYSIKSCGPALGIWENSRNANSNKSLIKLVNLDEFQYDAVYVGEDRISQGLAFGSKFPDIFEQIEQDNVKFELNKLEKLCAKLGLDCFFKQSPIIIEN